MSDDASDSNCTSFMMSDDVSDTNCIREGDFVIVKAENILRLLELNKRKPYYLGKRKANLFFAIGQPYGSFFEITADGNLKKSTAAEVDESLNVKVYNNEETKDNRALIDTGNSQKLTTVDIEAYKAQGLSGQEMVKIIVENSSSFHEKTSFSKEKYLRKKQSKYMKFVQILKPNVRLLAEMYYSQGPLKICNLRIDSLSQMLAFCNVMSGCKYIIIETVNGLLTASVLERIGVHGCVIQMHLGPSSKNPCQQAIKALNIPADTMDSLLYNIDLRNAMKILQQSLEKTDDSEANTDLSVIDHEPKFAKKQHVNKAKEILAYRDIDSLLVAVKHHPANVLPLIDFLAYSRPFAIFSMFQEPLVDCYVNLKSRGDIILLNISETWFRKYQVLPDRTHPCYSMSGNGGFLLTGVKVDKKGVVH